MNLARRFNAGGTSWVCLRRIATTDSDILKTVFRRRDATRMFCLVLPGVKESVKTLMKKLPEKNFGHIQPVRRFSIAANDF